MDFFTKYPMTDAHELNLDWIIKTVKRVEKIVDDFTVFNTITWAGIWDATKSYTKWNIVQDVDGNGYISIQPVPANVNISNTDYWVEVADYDALYAAFNSRITNLENAVNTLENTTIPDINNDISDINDKLANLNNKQIIIICDSYGNHVNADGNNFYVQAFANLNFTDYYDFHRGSAGFTQAGTYNFLTVLTDNESVITDKTLITDVIVCGGANDQGDPSLIAANMQSFITYVKTNYINAKIHIGHFSNSIEPTYSPNLLASIMEYKKCVDMGASYIDNSQYVMIKLEHFDTDNVHPSVTGVNALTKYFESYILTHHIDVLETAETTLEPLAAGFTIASDTLKFQQHNGQITAYGSGGGGALALSFSTPLSFTPGDNMKDNLLSVTGGFFYSLNNIKTYLSTLNGNQGVWKSGYMYARNIGNNKTVNVGLFIYSENSVTMPDGVLYINIGPQTFSALQN